MSFTEKIYFEVNVSEMIERQTEEQELAWDDLINSQPRIPEIRPCYFPLSHWLVYRNDPFENFKVSQSPSEYQGRCNGYLGKIIGEYILKQNPNFKQWNQVLLFIDW